MLKPRIAVLVSGGGTNLQSLIDAQSCSRLSSGEIALVIASKSGAFALERAKTAQIETETVDRAAFSSQTAFEERLLAVLVAHQIDLIVLAGFMHILSAAFVTRYPERIVNVHPSLIPAYCGKGFYGIKVHEAVLAAGESETGATVHMVNEVPDGGRIILQQSVPVFQSDTSKTLQRRVMEQAEWILLPRAVEQLCADLIAQEKSGASMRQQNLFELLKNNPYPGRGIVLGLTPDGKKAALAYFIMGRSAGSRSRAFVKNGDDIGIHMLDGGKTADTSLILYTPLRKLRSAVVVTNGDQTDTICAALANGGTFETALRTRTFEPDAPHFTPRISGMLDFSDGFSYKLSILKAGDEVGKTTLRQTFDVEPLAGAGHFIHTYQTDGAVLPSFSGEPVAVAILNDFAAFAQGLWGALNPANKVSLYVRYTDLTTSQYEDRIFNQYAQYATKGEPA
jgi:phosphoribosylglycinamide formyltransferase-1